MELAYVLRLQNICTSTHWHMSVRNRSLLENFYLNTGSINRPNKLSILSFIYNFFESNFSSYVFVRLRIR